MRVLFTGFFDPLYSRNRILKRGLEENKVDVLFEPLGVVRFVSVLRLASRLLRGGYDTVLLGHSDDALAPLISRLFSRAPIVWDSFYSLYDTRVEDRKLISRYSIKAWWFYFLDRINLIVADHVLFDTKEHQAFFGTMHSRALSKSTVVYVGADDTVFYPQQTQSEERLVGFYGKFIPLQGISTIVRAAKLLEKEGVHFELIGSGQEYTSCRALADELSVQNIVFKPRVPYEALPAIMARWSLALGIFGTSDKAARVIPNKVYEAAAMGKAIITRHSPACQELFSAQELKFCSPTPESLAKTIRELLSDSPTRTLFEQKSRAVFEQCLTPYMVTQPLVEQLKKAYNGGHDR